MSSGIEAFVKSNTGMSRNKFNKFTICLDNLTSFVESGDNIYITPKDETVYKMMYFIRNSVRNLIDVFPNIVLNKNNYSSVTIPKHWKLSQKHNKDIKNLIDNYYKNLKPYYGELNLETTLEQIQINCSDIQKLAIATPFFASFTKKQEDINSIFDDRLTELLFKYYVLLILNNYITLTNIQVKPITLPVLPVGDDFEKLQTEILIDATADLEKRVKEEIEPEQEPSLLEQATLAGDKQEKNKVLSNYLVTIIEMLCEDKKAINYNKTTIMSKILTSKEKEKNDMTEYLKDKTDEERSVDGVFKKHKLGSWGAGLRKSLIQYDEHEYDKVRDAEEKLQLKEKQLNKNTEITADEIDENSLIAERIEDDVYSLTSYGGEDEPEILDGNDPDNY